VSEVLIGIMTPVAIEVTFAVQRELQARLDEVDRLRQQQVARARYEAELAQRRYMRVDPDNRLVADTLEADWNRKLRAVQEAQQEYAQQHQHDRVTIDAELRTRLPTLATEFPRLWRDPETPGRERKRLLRLLVEDVTLVKREQFHIHIRFPGGATKTLELPLPRRATVTQPAVVAGVDRLLDEHSYEAIADILNARGFVSGYGKPFRGRMIARLTIEYRLKSRFDRLRARGMLTLDEMADRLGISTRHVKIWRAAGLLRAHLCNDKTNIFTKIRVPIPHGRQEA